MRRFLAELAIKREHYHGYPVPDYTCPLELSPKFPFQALNGITLGNEHELEDEVDAKIRELVLRLPRETQLQLAAAEARRGELINTWFCHKEQFSVAVYRRPDGKSYCQRFYQSVGRRAKLLLHTMGVSQCWDPSAEMQAMLKLQTLVKPHIFEYYFLTGTFLETSQRSKVLYVFRRCRPTLAFGQDQKFLAALCLHTVGYYKESFAGAMVPTDDVISHLLLMRGDEHRFWKQSNQHSHWYPEAGI